MAPIRKRKRNSAQSYTDKPSRKRKQLSGEIESAPTTQTQSDWSSQREFKARGILAESKTKYQIDWEDDPVTGKGFAPTWEPKGNANEELVRDWIEKKEAQEKQKETAARNSPAQSVSQIIQTTPVRTKNDRGRRRPIIQSSPAELAELLQQPASETSPLHINQEGADRRPLSQSPLFEPLDADSQRPERPARPDQDHVVSITQPSDFDPVEYDHYPSGQQTSSSAQPVETPGPKDSTGSLSLVVPTTIERSGIVPDSQSLPGSSSYIPSTQAQSGSKSDLHGVLQNVPTSSSTEGPQLESTVEEVSALGPESSSAPVLESDLIEAGTSPVVAEDHSDHFPDSPVKSATSASSPPPSEDPEKTQSESHTQSHLASSASQQNQEASSDPSKELSSEEHEDIRPQEEISQSAGQEVVGSSAQQETHEPSDEPESQIQVVLTDPSLQEAQLTHRSDLSLSSVAPPQPPQIEAVEPTANSGPQELADNPEPQVESASGSPRGAQTLHQTVLSLNTVALTLQDQARLHPEAQLRDSPVQSQTVETEQPPERVAVSSREHTPPQSQEDLVGDLPQTGSQPRHSPEAVLSKGHQPLLEHTNTATASQENARGQGEGQGLNETVPRSSNPKDLQVSPEPLQEPPAEPALPLEPIQRQVQEATPETVPFESRAIPLNGTHTPPLGLNLSSSPVPQAPSQLPETFRTNPPFSLQTPSHLSDVPRSSIETMSTNSAASASATPGLTLTERLAAMRARHAAKREATRLARSAEFAQSSPSTRSPSVIPDKMPLRSALPDDPTVSRRLRTLLPDQPNNPPLEVVAKTPEPVVGEDDPSIIPIGRPSLGVMEFVVPLPLLPTAGDQYKSTVLYNRKMIEEFTSDNWETASPLLEQAAEFVNTMHDVATHADLTNVGTLTQQDVLPETQAQWDRSCSAKFKFLYHLLNRLRGQDMHAIIVARPGRLLDMLETFLNGDRVSYARPDQSRKADPSKSSGTLTVSLLPTSGEGSGAIVRSASFIISVDHTLDVSSRNIQALRKHLLDDSQLSPVIHLVVVNSAEHIERCLPASLQGPERLRALVSYITQNRQRAGKLPGGCPKPEPAAMEVARFLTAHGTEDQWPLPALPDIPGMDSLQAHDSESSLTSLESVSTEEVPTAQKRLLDDQMDLDSCKRVRLTPQPGTVNPNDNSITHISNSITEHSSQIQKNAPQFGRSAEPKDAAALREKLEAMGARLKEAEARYLDAESRVREHAAALNDLQTRFEAQTIEKVSLRKAREETNGALALAIKRQEHQSTLIASLESERDSLREQLQAARTALLTSTVPEVAELEALRQAKHAAETARRRAEERLAALEKDFDFMRAQYQSASSLAAEHAAQSERMAAEVGALTRKAAGEAGRLRELSRGEAAKRDAERVEMLEQTLRDREALLNRKEEEIRLLKQARTAAYGTRAGSVPIGARSPRVGPASRASSPMHGGRLGVLRNG